MEAQSILSTCSCNAGKGSNKAENEGEKQRGPHFVSALFGPDRRGTIFDAQRIVAGSKSTKGLHLKPRSDYGKITENGSLSGIQFWCFSSSRYRKETRSKGILLSGIAFRKFGDIDAETVRFKLDTSHNFSVIFP